MNKKNNKHTNHHKIRRKEKNITINIVNNNKKNVLNKYYKVVIRFMICTVKSY